MRTGGPRSQFDPTGRVAPQTHPETISLVPLAVTKQSVDGRPDRLFAGLFNIPVSVVGALMRLKRPLSLRGQMMKCSSSLQFISVLACSVIATPTFAQSIDPAEANREIDNLESEVFKPGNAVKAHQDLDDYCKKIGERLRGLDRKTWEPVAAHCGQAKKRMVDYNGGTPYVFVPNSGPPAQPPSVSSTPPIVPPNAPKPPIRRLANLPKPPPTPDAALPACFPTLAARIAATNEMGYLKNKWWGYANTLRGMAGKFGGPDNPDWPSYLAAVQDADAEEHLASDLQYKLAAIPICPEVSMTTGLYIGGEIVKNWGWVRSTERLDATGLQTNQFTDSADPVGGGFLIGYKFAPWANNIVVSPFASFDFLSAPVNHTFPGGSYLGTTANFMGTGGVKIGPQFGGVWLYGIAGVSGMNETLNINFIPVSSSQSAWVAGGTLGFGGAFQPGFLQGFGRPVSLFAEYHHTWWQSANFNTPVASPLFNYNFARQDDVVKLGFTVPLGVPPPSAAPSYPVKATMLK